jgi:hypothetical protein
MSVGPERESGGGSNVEVATEAGCKCGWGRPRLCRRDGDGDAAEPQLLYFFSQFLPLSGKVPNQDRQDKVS